MADLKIPPPPDTLAPKFMTAVIAAVVVGGLYLGRPVLLPLSLAVLMSFALAPLVGVLRHLKLGHVPSVLLSLVFALVLLSGIGAFVGSQFAGLAGDLPKYQSNIGHKIQSIRGSTTGNGTFARFNHTIEALGDQITGARDQNAPAAAGAPAEEKPVPVEIRRETIAPWEMAQNILGPLLEPLGLMALVLVFVGFILLQKDDLRDRFVRLAGSKDMQRTTIALDEAATRLSRYLFLQTIINASFGCTIGIGLWLIGVPNAGLWALIGMLFRFVPYVGVPIAFLFPATLAVAVDPGWAMLIWTMVLFGCVEAVVGQAIEPFVYGRSMGLSAVAVVVAAVFWTWLWGPMGLLLSTPLTMCFVVLGRHIDSLKFLDVMLGDEPALAIEESLYLRMLAEDPDDATEEAENFLKSSTLSVYYDEVAARALMLAQADVNRGALDPMRQTRIRDAIKGLIGNLSERKDAGAAAALAELPSHWRQTPVLCVAGRGPLDEAAALLLVDMLDKYGIAARVVSSDQTSAAQIEALDVEGVRVTCVSYLEPGTYKNARYQVRRLRKRMPGLPVLAIFWGLAGDHTGYLDSVEATECDVVTTGLKETIHHILAFARRAVGAHQLPQEFSVMTRYGMLLTTLPSKNAAMKMARLLIDERLAACVQLSSIESFYRWQGETKQAAETLLLIKTAKTQFETAIARIRQKHPYEVPEIVAMDFVAGFAGYFGWIDESLKPPAKAAKKAPLPKAKAHPRNDGGILAKKNTGLRTGISRPMRVK